MKINPAAVIKAALSLSLKNNSMYCVLQLCRQGLLQAVPIFFISKQNCILQISPEKSLVKQTKTKKTQLSQENTCKVFWKGALIGAWYTVILQETLIKDGILHGLQG